MTERGLHELYAEDPERADYALWGRRSDKSRRGFLTDTGLLTMTAALGATIPFYEWMPGGLIPIALADETSPFQLAGKDGLRVLNDRPINAETPPHLLNDAVTPNNRLFVRNNGLVPEMATKQDAKGWTLTIDGEVAKPLTLSLQDLKKKFTPVTLDLVLECGGNGRAAFFPPAKGNQWTFGAVGCPRWTGVRLADVLEAAGLKKSAIYTGYYGLDRHLSGDPNKVVISRGTPIAKALEPTTLIAYEMNGKPLPAYHGFPARTVCPGFPGSASGKWLQRLTMRDQVHDGPKMTGSSYRVPRHPVAPGTKVPKEDMVIIEEMPVKSLITSPQSGKSFGANKIVKIAGAAWSGHGAVKSVEISQDFGRSWVVAELAAPKNKFAWQRWQGELRFKQRGYYEVWARATDHAGNVQPLVVPGWNPKGYLNNASPRIAVYIA